MPPLPRRYVEWIAHLFDHPASAPEWYWYWELEAPIFEADEAELVELIAATFYHFRRDLAQFSDAQLSQGLTLLCSVPCSDYSFALFSPAVPLVRRCYAIAGIAELYRQLFLPRCTPVLSHLEEGPVSPLNGICYMLWDLLPTSRMQDEPREERQMVATCFAVLEQMLALDHLACKEAAVHGYGELYCFYPEQVEEGIGRFLREAVVDERLRSYAERARVGDIQ